MAYCLAIALFEGSLLMVQSRKLLIAVNPFPVMPPPSTTACSLWRAQSSVPSPLLRGKCTFLDQLQCLGNGPVAPLVPLHIPIICLHIKKPQHLILSCTPATEKVGK